MLFNKNLCSLMKDREVSSYKLAKALGVHVSTVTNWRGNAKPTYEHLISISEFFNVPITKLLLSEIKEKNCPKLFITHTKQNT